MAFFSMVGFLEFFMAITCFLILVYIYSKLIKTVLLQEKALSATHLATLRKPINWPLVGMLPELFLHISRLHDWLTDALNANGCTFLYKGAWFTGTDTLITADPANAHYILSQNFPNFPKGPKFREMFDVLGDGILNSDHESWRNQRNMAHTLLNQHSFQRFSAKTNQEKLQNGLVPVLDHLCAQELSVDLEDLMKRFTSDVLSILTTGCDPRSLSADFHDVPYMKALGDVEKAIVFRHVLPKCVWKFARWLNVGPEKKLSEAWLTLDRTVAGYISKKRQELGQVVKESARVDLLESYIKSGQKDEFLRDTILTFMIAGMDTTSAALSWFFWLLSKNPSAIIKIREELANELGAGSFESFDKCKNLNDLMYLHGALCETLRLYPSLPFEYKSPIAPDILPSGHKVDPKSSILFSLYAMGRMRSIWGDDCMEFKPERWITERGGIKHQPSYKFLAFNAGPRTCIGKQMAFTQMKMVAAVIIHNYDVEVVEGHEVVPSVSLFLHMKNGLMVKINKRRS